MIIYSILVSSHESAKKEILLKLNLKESEWNIISIPEKQNLQFYGFDMNYDYKIYMDRVQYSNRVFWACSLPKHNSCVLQ